MPGPKDLGNYHDGEGDLENCVTLVFFVEDLPHLQVLTFGFNVYDFSETNSPRKDQFRIERAGTMVSLSVLQRESDGFIDLLCRFREHFGYIAHHPAGPNGLAEQEQFLRVLESDIIGPILQELPPLVEMDIVARLTVTGCNAFTKDIRPREEM